MFVAGVQKGGTTSLFTRLAQHPAFAAPLKKEPHFFDEEGRDWDRPDYEVLHAEYPTADGRLRFESTPVYSYWEPAMARIHRYNPDALIILLLRDPAQRALSQWRMERANGGEKLSFLEAIRAEPARLAKSPPWCFFWSAKSFVARGRYGTQLARILEYFPRERVLLLRSEDFFARQAETLAAIASFLGVGPFPEQPTVHEHQGDPALSAPDEALDEVRHLLAEDLALFASLSGWDVRDWLAPQSALA
ncbi:deacetylase sulfotransferase [Acidisoma sp. 7E03]